jgi:hypothetical protein
MKMEQNKIETQIREKLNSRKIKPTEMAWDKLDAMLSLAEQTKSKRSFGWLNIAAGILVFLSIVFYFFNQNSIENSTENNVVVKDEVNKDVNENNSFKINKQEEKVAENPKLKTKNPQQSSKTFNQINPKLIESNPEKLSGNPEVIAENPIAKITIDEKPIQVKSQLDDIDALLATASKSIKEKSQKSDSKIKINSGALLTQVDEEVDLTFRKKVLNKIANKFEEIKVVITTRNTINERIIKNTQQ